MCLLSTCSTSASGSHQQHAVPSVTSTVSCDVSVMQTAACLVGLTAMHKVMDTNAATREGLCQSVSQSVSQSVRAEVVMPSQ